MYRQLGIFMAMSRGISWPELNLVTIAEPLWAD
jgi:hypothetical protein